MPKVLHVVADGAPGGGTTAALGLCSDLSDAGWQVAFITQADSYGLETAGGLGLETHGVDFFQSRFDLSVAGRLRAAIDQVKPDLVHVHGARAGHPFCLPALAELACPLVYTVQGYHFLNHQLHMKALGWFAERRIAHRADHVVFVSSNDKQIGSRLRITSPRTSRSVIYNSVDGTELDRVPRTRPTYDLVFVARMHRQKNPLFVIDIMAELAKDKISLRIVGGGDMEDEVRAYAKRRGVSDSITFEGSASRDQVLSAVVSGRIYLYPSLWEGLPIGPIESMYLGVPVIASAIGGTDEVVVDQETGFLLRTFDAASYASAIRRLLNDDELYRTFSEAGKQRVSQLFLRKKCTADHILLYERLLAASKRPNMASSTKPQSSATAL